MKYAEMKNNKKYSKSNKNDKKDFTNNKRNEILLGKKFTLTKTTKKNNFWFIFLNHETVDDKRFYSVNFILITYDITLRRISTNAEFSPQFTSRSFAPTRILICHQKDVLNAFRTKVNLNWPLMHTKMVNLNAFWLQ